MNDSVQRRLPFLDRVRPNGVPRRHQYYEGAKTSCAEYEVAYGFASSLQSLSPSSLPCGGDFRPGLARLSPVACGVLNWSNTGPPRFLGRPSRTFALLSDPGRSGWPHLGGQLSSVPTVRKVRTPATTQFRGSITRLQCTLSTLQVMRYRIRMQDSVPAAG